MQRTSPVYYIAPSAVSIIPNANGQADDLSVSVARGCKIKVYYPYIAELDTGADDANYMEWTLLGRNRQLAESDSPYTIYARLSKTDRTDGYLVFAPQVEVRSGVWAAPYVLSPNTSSTEAMTVTDLRGREHRWRALPEAQTEKGREGYWWIAVGTVSAPQDGVRTVSFDTGILGTDRYNERWDLNEDENDLHVELSVTVDGQDGGSTPYVRWGSAAGITATLMNALGEDAGSRVRYWTIARSTGNGDADQEWNYPYGDLVPVQEDDPGPDDPRRMPDGAVVLSHEKDGTDDLAGAVAAVFTITAWGDEFQNLLGGQDTGEADEGGDDDDESEAVDLASAVVTVLAEGAGSYRLVLTPRSVGYNPDSYEPRTVKVSALATASDGVQQQAEISGRPNSGILRVFWAHVSASGEVKDMVRLLPETAAESVTEIGKLLEADDCEENSGIRFELRRYEDTELGDLPTEGFIVCDSDTVEIVKAVNGDPGEAVYALLLSASLVTLKRNHAGSVTSASPETYRLTLQYNGKSAAIDTEAQSLWQRKFPDSNREWTTWENISGLGGLGVKTSTTEFQRSASDNSWYTQIEYALCDGTEYFDDAVVSAVTLSMRWEVQRMLVPAGTWNSEQTYKRTDNTTPLVYFPVEGVSDYWFLDADSVPAGEEPSADSTYWSPCDEFQVVLAKMLFADFALLGSFVIYSSFFVSQYGELVYKNKTVTPINSDNVTRQFRGIINGNEVSTVAYGFFRDYDPMAEEKDGDTHPNEWPRFRPTKCIDALTGEEWSASGNVHFSPDGGVSIQGTEISVSKDGSVSPVATEAMLEGYVSVKWFKKLFTAHSGNGDVVEPNIEADITDIEAMFGFWTKQYISAQGIGSGGSGGGGAALDEPLLSINAIGSNPPDANQTLVFDGLHWTYGSAGLDKEALGQYLSTNKYLTESGMTDYEWWGQKFSSNKKISGQIKVEGNIVDVYHIKPKINDTYSLGASNLRFDKAYIRELWIGGVQVKVENGGVHIVNAGLYADTYVSALGTGSGGSGGGGTVLSDPLLSINNSSLGSAAGHSNNTFIYNGSSWVWSGSEGATLNLFKLAVGTVSCGGTIQGSTISGTTVAGENVTVSNSLNVGGSEDGNKLYVYGNFSLGGGVGKIDVLNMNVIASQGITFKKTSTSTSPLLSLDFTNSAVGIGTSAQNGYKLYVSSGNIKLSGITITDGGSGTWEISTPTTLRLSATNVSIKATTFSGNVDYTGSDMRKKDVIDQVATDIEKIAESPIFNYKLKDGSCDRVLFGSSAQYWQNVFPNAVAENEGSLFLDYGATALAAAVMTARTVLTHEERIAALEAENKRLKDEIEQLKAA